MSPFYAIGHNNENLTLKQTSKMIKFKNRKEVEVLQKIKKIIIQNTILKMEDNSWGWYSLKYDLAESILPKLENYKKGYLKEGMCIPDWVLKKKKETYSEKEIKELQILWIKEIDKMLLAFRQILNYKTGEDENIGYDEDQIQKGLDSFAKHFQHFWD